MTLFLFICLIIFIVAIACLYRHFHRSDKTADKYLGIALAVTLPMLTLLGYLTIGNPQAVHLADQNKLSQPLDQTVEQLSPEQIEKAINALVKETRDNPNDMGKLVMLANSYTISQRFQESASTWDKIVQLDGSAENLLRAADAHTFANQGAVNSTSQDLIDRALALAPEHPQALWMAGMSAVQKGELAVGKVFWQRLYPMLASQPSQQQELAVLIKQLDTELANPTPSSATQAKIRINVSIDPSVKDQVKPSDTVFVFARAVQGPPAPLAVKQLQVKALPTTIELTEQDAMIATMTITSFPKIQISAKVSKSGNPSNREGDILSAVIELESLVDIEEQALVIGRQTTQD